MSLSRESLSGFDPYDALRGSRVPAFVRKNARLRQAVIQARKRSRIDLSRLLGVEPFLMAKTAAGFMAAAARKSAAGETDSDAESIAALLLGDSDVAHSGPGAWGYEFDVQTRWAFYAAGTPNLIATAFVGRAMGEAGVVCRRQAWLDEFHACARFVDGKLRDPDGWYRYTPYERDARSQRQSLGCRLVRCFGAPPRISGRSAARGRCRLVSVSAQREDGSWVYGRQPHLQWCDNFHTAYNLDGLLSVWLASGDSRVSLR